MRPARKGPENDLGAVANVIPRYTFNEAGPQGAGKRYRGGVRGGGDMKAFNEAGPQGAGKHAGRPHGPARPAPSMRPARKGPENGGLGGAAAGAAIAFNEAGPQGAGKPGRQHGQQRAAHPLQ